MCRHPCTYAEVFSSRPDTSDDSSTRIDAEGATTKRWVVPERLRHQRQEQRQQLIESQQTRHPPGQQVSWTDANEAGHRGRRELFVQDGRRPPVNSLFSQADHHALRCGIFNAERLFFTNELSEADQRFLSGPISLFNPDPSRARPLLSIRQKILEHMNELDTQASQLEQQVALLQQTRNPLLLDVSTIARDIASTLRGRHSERLPQLGHITDELQKIHMRVGGLPVN